MIEWQTDPTKELMTWHEAMKYAESLGDGWRLPTRAELIDAYDNNVEGFIEDSYWSLSEYKCHCITSDIASTCTYKVLGYNTDAWYVNFEYGEVIDHDKTNNKYVRCVREVKGEMKNKIEQLEKELNELKKITESERWKPYQEGFNIEGDYYGHALPPGFKNERFRTKEMARLRQKQIEAENELFNIWEHLVGDWRPDWNNEDEKKYYIEYWEGIPDCESTYTVIDKPSYRYFPTFDLAIEQYELASAHARSYIRGEF